MNNVGILLLSILSIRIRIETRKTSSSCPRALPGWGSSSDIASIVSKHCFAVSCVTRMKGLSAGSLVRTVRRESRVRVQQERGVERRASNAERWRPRRSYLSVWFFLFLFFFLFFKATTVHKEREKRRKKEKILTHAISIIDHPLFSGTDLIRIIPKWGARVAGPAASSSPPHRHH